MNDARGKKSCLAPAMTALAVLSCYGAVVLISLLSLLGISLALDDGVWTGAISLFTALAVLAVATSYPRHRIIGPLVVAALGFALILWVMYGAYSAVIEFVGFALLVAAALWDWRAGARRPSGAEVVSWIDAGDLAARLNGAARPLIIDVRGRDEFGGALGHLQGARNIPLDELRERLSEIRDAGNRPIALVCRTQMRSAKAASLLKSAGFGDVRVLRGGMERWNQIGLPVEGQSPQARH